MPSNARAVLLLLVACALPACGGGGGGGAPSGPSQPTPTPTPAQRPNLVLIVMDDLDASSIESMPRLERLVYAQGLRFTNMVVTTPLCAPSRASFFTGQYAHNHGILGNGPPLGAYEIFRERGYDSESLGPWLQAAGYRTVMLGKYMNNFPLGDDTYIPPGWNEWFGVLSDRRADNADYQLNENGTINRYRGGGESDHQTDVLRDRLIGFIDRAEADDSQPFFAYVGVTSPHAPPEPADRHVGSFAGFEAPRVASFNEDDVSDKPRWLQRAKPLTAGEIAELDALYADRQESLQAVDELVELVLAALDRRGELANTWLFVTSDNGVFHGQHRLPGGKGVPYEEAISVPLAVRGPGTGGRVIDQVVANIDFVPTLLDLAGAPARSSVDGRSMVPLLRGSSTSWRAEVLIQGAGTGEPLRSPAYTGVRSRDNVYVEYEDGEREIYDFSADPGQLDNAITTAEAALVERLAGRLAALRSCAGASCN